MATSSGCIHSYGSKGASQVTWYKEQGNQEGVDRWVKHAICDQCETKKVLNVGAEAQTVFLNLTKLQAYDAGSVSFWEMVIYVILAGNA